MVPVKEVETEKQAEKEGSDRARWSGGGANDEKTGGTKTHIIARVRTRPKPEKERVSAQGETEEGGGGQHEERKTRGSVGCAGVEREGQKESEGGCVEAHDQKEQKKKLQCNTPRQEKNGNRNTGKLKLHVPTMYAGTRS